MVPKNMSVKQNNTMMSPRLGREIKMVFTMLAMPGIEFIVLKAWKILMILIT